MIRRASFSLSLLLVVAAAAVALGLRADAHPYKVDYHSDACQATGGTVSYSSDGVRGSSLEVYCPLPNITLTTDTSSTPTLKFQALYAGNAYCNLYGEWTSSNVVVSCPGTMGGGGILSGPSGGCVPSSFPTNTSQPPFGLFLSCWLDTNSYLGQIQVSTSP
jgi:hypothetical protein